MALHITRALALSLLALSPARADVAPLAGFAAAPLAGGTTPLMGGSSAGPAAPLFNGGVGAAPASSTGSLFAGTATGSLFAPLPPRARGEPVPTHSAQGPAADLLGLIAQAEAGRDGYDAVQHGAQVRPPRPPTQLTLGEIYAWIAATPGQPHAIGRYQFIPPTLRQVAGVLGLGPETPFTPQVQDALALVLLDQAGLPAFEAGTLGRRAFMHNLARIWAGLPLPNGQSYYEGHAGNRAAMSWAEFEGGVLQIWPTS